MTPMDAFTQFASTTANWPMYATEANGRAVVERAKTYGENTVSAYRRAFHELVNSRTLKVVPGYKAPVVPVSAEFRARVQNMSSSELLKQFKTDQQFHTELDRLWSEDAVPASSKYATFSAQDWKSAPPATLARLLQNKDFKARVDQLVAQGLI